MYTDFTVELTSFPCSMRLFPRWRGLKHFNEVTSIEYTDGRSHFDILMVRLSRRCVAHLTPIAHSVVFSAFFHVLSSSFPPIHPSYMRYAPCKKSV